MRIFICASLLLVCLVVIPSVQCQKKYKLSEYDERDKRDTKQRYTKRDEDNQKYKKSKYRDINSDEELRESKPENKRKLKRQVVEEEAPQKKKLNKNNDNGRSRKITSKRLQESEEEFTEETNEVEVSEVCVDKRGRRCESEDITEEETNEDFTEEDESDYGRKKKKVIYIKKFAHEKKKKSNPDKEAGSILKIHKRAGELRHNEEDESSEEVGVPKRRRYIYEEDEE